jgi:tetratricopeptide (TPR) repeat protein
MQRKFDEIRDDFMRALQTANWNDVMVHSTDLLLLDDKLPWVWANRGMALHKMGFYLDALLNYDKALALEETATAYNNKGATYFDLEKTTEAMDCYTKAIRLDPNLAQVYMNVGHVNKWLGEDKKSIAAYRKAVKADPNYADGQIALAMALIKDGQFKDGWKRYEWRWKTDQLVPRNLKRPTWKGEDLTDRILLVYAEQGLGDIIQFAR